VLAENEAHSFDPGAIALLLDINGFVAEPAGRNIFVVKGGKLFTPTRNSILEGVTRGVTLELAKKAGIEALEMDLCPYDLYNADEVFVTATSYVIQPVSKINNIPLRTLVPGPITKELVSAWKKLVGVDFIQQALELAGVTGSNR
jgi:branched-chain amino acid aminotransferase